jgi:polyisoprenoid-binding protein YceI
MKLMIASLVMSVTLASGTALAGGAFKLSSKNTKIEFTGTKPQGKHDGGFQTVSGTASATAGDPTSLKLDVEIETASLYSDTPKLTQHLKSPDFFAIKDYPKAKFVSTKVAKSGGSYTITGDLTLIGKTKTISFPADITVSDDALSVSSKFQINRHDFGMSFGKGKIDDEVTLKVSLKATK